MKTKIAALFIAVAAAVLLVLLTRLWANDFNPGYYNLSYNSGASLVQSGVIASKTAMIGSCTFYNNTAANAFFMLYASSTVAGQADSNLIGMCLATATNICSIASGGPAGPNINAAIVTPNGASWFMSSTYPTQTGAGTNGKALCQYTIHTP